MALDHSLIGVPSEPHERSWTSADALLYAIAVGAGLGDPLNELEFTTENSAGIEQQVLLLSSTTSAFIRGEGGFGGDRGPPDSWARPDRDPDLQVTQPTRPEQALLYRLTGDRNPLHTDPAFAARGGFATPILHGLCTYGFTGRALLHAVCGGDPARFGCMSGRFSQPVLPGETLITSIWRDDDGALFQTAKPDGTVVIDRGRMQVRD